MICSLECTEILETKISFSLTTATYGMSEKIPILESDKIESVNPYGETKLPMEKCLCGLAK